MTGNDLMFATPPAKTGAGATTRPPVAAVSGEQEKKQPIELDMGEASRLEGFRLYGCR